METEVSLLCTIIIIIIIIIITSKEYNNSKKLKVEHVKFSLEQDMKAQRGIRGIAPIFL
jgi:hypothetical protein